MEFFKENKFNFDEEDWNKFFNLLLGDNFFVDIIKTDMPYNNVFREKKGREYATFSAWSYLDALVILPKEAIVLNKRYTKEELTSLLNKYHGVIRNFQIGDFPKNCYGFEKHESDYLDFDVMYKIDLQYIKEKYPLIYDEFLEYILDKYKNVKVKRI